MRRVDANDRPEAYHRTEPARLCHRPRHQGNLEYSRDPRHLDVVGLAPLLLNRSMQELSNLLVTTLLNLATAIPNRNPVALCESF